MTTRRPPAQVDPRARRGFTLVELLIVMAIIALMASLSLAALYNAQEQAKADATQTLIQRLGSLMMQRYESYRYRPVNVNLNGVANRGQARQLLVSGRREMVRMEMADRFTDLQRSTSTVSNRITLRNDPSGYGNLRRRLQPEGTIGGQPWSAQFQGAECLYAIVTSTELGDQTGAKLFPARSIGDADGDGRSEILDAWGTPIEYIRWAPGFNSPLQNQSVVLTLSVNGRTGGGDYTITGKRGGTTATSDPIPYQVASGLPSSTSTTELYGIMKKFATDLGGNVTDPNAANYVQILITGPTDAEVALLRAAETEVASGPWSVEFFGMTGIGSVTANGANLTSTTDAGGQELPPPQVKVTNSYVDPLDPDNIYGQDNPPLFPLIISAGPDEIFDLWGLSEKGGTLDAEVAAFRYATSYSRPPDPTGPPVITPAMVSNNPYKLIGTATPLFLGAAYDTSGDGNSDGWSDNISNHLIFQN